MTSSIRISKMISLLQVLVEMESPSHDKEAVDRVAGFIAEKCNELGAEVTIHHQHKVGNIVGACWRANNASTSKRAKGEKILILCHMDTVFPCGTIEKMPFNPRDDVILGPGVADMKGGIVVALTAVASIIETGNLSQSITILFTSDEEIGSENSKSLIEQEAMEATLVLVLEPGMPDGSLKTWRKGVGNYHIHVRGRAAHSGGNHESGRNAIEELAYQVIKIQQMTDYRKGTTLNTGIIYGGTASNVVPDSAEADIDLRILHPAEAERIDSLLRALSPVISGTSIEIRGGINRPPMPEDLLMKQTYEKARRIALGAGLTLTAAGTGGASDANFIAPLGIPVLDGLGPAGGEYHSEREFIYRSSLSERAHLLKCIIQGW